LGLDIGTMSIDPLTIICLEGTLSMEIFVALVIIILLVIVTGHDQQQISQLRQCRPLAASVVENDNCRSFLFGNHLGLVPGQCVFF